MKLIDVVCGINDQIRAGKRIKRELTYELMILEAICGGKK